MHHRCRREPRLVLVSALALFAAAAAPSSPAAASFATSPPAERGALAAPPATNPAALGFLEARTAAFVSGRWTASRADEDLPDSLVSDWSATRLAPLAAGVTFGFAPRGPGGVRAGIAVTYARTADGFESGDVRHAPTGTTESIAAHSTSDEWTLGLAVCPSSWVALGVAIGMQRVRNDAVAEGSEAPVAAALESRLTPVLAYGIDARPGRRVEIAAYSRPAVTMLWSTASIDTAGRGTLSFSNASTRSDAALGGTVTAHVTETIAIAGGVDRIGTVEVAMTAPSGSSAASFDARPAQWSSLWSVETRWAPRPDIAVRAGVAHALRGAWSFDGQAATAVRGFGPTLGGDVAVGALGIALDLHALAFHGTAPLPVGGDPAGAHRRTHELRAALALRITR